MNQSDLQGISTFCYGERFAVILANDYQVNDAVRFVPFRPGETQRMPVRPWIVRDRGFAPSPREWAHNSCHWTATIASCSTSAGRKPPPTGSSMSQVQSLHYFWCGGCCGCTSYELLNSGRPAAERWTRNWSSLWESCECAEWRREHGPGPRIISTTPLATTNQRNRLSDDPL